MSAQRYGTRGSRHGSVLPPDLSPSFRAFELIAATSTAQRMSNGLILKALAPTKNVPRSRSRSVTEGAMARSTPAGRDRKVKSGPRSKPNRGDTFASAEDPHPSAGARTITGPQTGRRALKGKKATEVKYFARRYWDYLGKCDEGCRWPLCSRAWVEEAPTGSDWLHEASAMAIGESTAQLPLIERRIGTARSPGTSRAKSEA